MLALAQRHVHGGPIWEIYALDPATRRFSFDGQIATENEVERSVRMVELSDARLLVLGAPLTPPAIPNEDMVVYRLDRSPEPSTIFYSADGLAKIGDLPGCGNVVDAVVGAKDRVVVLCLASDDVQPRRSSCSIHRRVGRRGSMFLSVPTPAALIRLADGRVLVAGGAGTTSLTVVDPSTGIRGPRGLDIDRAAPSVGFSTVTRDDADALADGRVLILSGIEASVFDPSTNAVNRVPRAQRRRGRARRQRSSMTAVSSCSAGQPGRPTTARPRPRPPRSSILPPSPRPC